MLLFYGHIVSHRQFDCLKATFEKLLSVVTWIEKALALLQLILAITDELDII